jgi:hypothetical protein
LSGRITGTTAPSTDAGQAAGATGTTDATLTAAGIGGIRRCRNTMHILDRYIAAIAAAGTIAAPTTVATITATTAVFVVLTAIAVAAIAARTALSARAARTTGTTVTTMRIDVHAGDEFGHRYGQRATILTSKSVGPIRGDGAIVASATAGAGIITIPMANRILSLPAGTTGLAAGTTVTIATSISVHVNIVRRHYLSPVSF